MTGWAEGRRQVCGPGAAHWLDSLDDGELRSMIREQGSEAFDLKEQVRELEADERRATERAYVADYLVGRANRLRPGTYGPDN